MQHRYLLLMALLLASCGISLTAQNIVSGPVIGAVTSHTATMMVQLKVIEELELQLNPTDGVNINTEIKSNGFVALLLQNLQAYTFYEYTLKIGTETITGSFRTFPEEGQKGSYTFVTGSCQETDNMKVFEVMPKHDPLFFMHTGDYAYPDVKIGNDFTADYTKVAQSYQLKYNEKIMKEMLLHLPINYVFDDHDHVNNDSGRFHSSGYYFKRKGMFRTNNFLKTDTFPIAWHNNAVKGYVDFFPHYEMADTAEAIHHSFKLGNAEFFVLDRCSSRRNPVEALFKKNKKGRWIFEPKPEHHLFGTKQMAWLKEGLKNSTADWKFIVSGVPLNKKLIKLLKTGVKMQRISTKSYGGFHIASAFANYWAAYPHELNDFYDFLEKENIKDVIVISGDTHHCVMDDGKNAGLPELNASGLSVDNHSLPKYMKLVGLVTLRFRYKKGIWNKGGIGLGNKIYKNGFGKVRIEEDKYVELSVVDEDNKEAASFKVFHSTYAAK